MRISDWSSDVCSSDLSQRCGPGISEGKDMDFSRLQATRKIGDDWVYPQPPCLNFGWLEVDRDPDRKSVVSGKSESVRVRLGGRRRSRKKRSTKLSYRTLTKDTD